MNRNLARLTAAVLVCIYALTVTVSGMFHTHGPHHCQTHSLGHRPLAPESCGGHAHHEHGDHPGEAVLSGVSVAGGPPEVRVTRRLGGECPVCSFLARKPVPTAPVFEIAFADLAAPPACGKAIARIEEPLSPIWSRGPPSVA